MRGLCTVLMCAVRPGISGTLNASCDSSQPFCVGQSGVVGGFQVAPCLVCLGTNDQIPLPLLLVLGLMLLIVVLKFLC